MMKSLKRVSVLMASCLLVSCFLMPASAAPSNEQPVDQGVNRFISPIDLKVSGTRIGRTLQVKKTINHDNNGGQYRVQLDRYNNKNPGYNVVMNTEMQNSNHENRGFGQTLQDTSNTIPNSASKGYVYSLCCSRQYATDDVKVHFTGTWSPDQW